MGESIANAALTLAPTIRQALGRPLLSYGMTPLLVFREVALVIHVYRSHKYDPREQIGRSEIRLLAFGYYRTDAAIRSIFLAMSISRAETPLASWVVSHMSIRLYTLDHSG